MADIPKITPLPTLQIFCVSVVEVCEGFDVFILFPFMAFMVEDFGYTGASIGYYTGILAASFSAAQFCSSVPWGMFSDHFGRKPSMILGCLGAGLGMLILGLSRSYAQAVLGRIVSGLLYGNIGVMKCFLTEVTDDTNRGPGFSYISLSWFIGSIIAPLVGGLLSKPADKYPGVFSKSGIFGVFPYLLPCSFCVLTNVLAAVVCGVLMKESKEFNLQFKEEDKIIVLENEQSTKDGIEMNNVELGSNEKQFIGVEENNGKSVLEVDNDVEAKENNEYCCLLNDQLFRFNCFSSKLSQVEKGTYSQVSTAESDKIPTLEEKSRGKVLKHVFLEKAVVLTTLNYALLCAATILLDETLPLFLKLRVEDGGFSFQSAEIGILFSISGVALIIFTLFFLPLISNNSKIWMMDIGVKLSIPFSLSYPFLSIFYYYMSSKIKNKLILECIEWGLLLFVTISKSMLNCLTYTAVIILVNHSTTSENLGAVNGLGQSLAALARAIGPALGGIIWTFSLKMRFVFANFIFVALIFFGCLIITIQLPKSLDYLKKT